MGREPCKGGTVGLCYALTGLFLFRDITQSEGRKAAEALGSISAPDLVSFKSAERLPGILLLLSLSGSG